MAGTTSIPTMQWAVPSGTSPPLTPLGDRWSSNLEPPIDNASGRIADGSAVSDDNIAGQ